jgi:nitrate/nitrite transporter NarK
MKKSGIFPGWWVVAGSAVGISFGSVIFVSGAFAQLANAWGHEFGWDQSQLAKAATIFLFLQMLTYPALGGLIDRYGSHKVAIASILLFALSLVALSRISGSLAQFYGAFVFIGLVSAGTNVVSYARAISLWFNRRRGLAIGLAAAAQAVGAVLIPSMTAKIVAASGWSTAVLVVAAVEIVVCLPLVAWLVKDSPAPYGLLPDGDDASPSGPTSAALLHGMTGAEIIRSVVFWKLAASFAVMGLTIYALSINVVFIMSKTAGMSSAEAAGVQAMSGGAVLLGRIGFGYLLDRLPGKVVGIMLCAIEAVGVAIYATSSSHSIILIGALLLGIAAGGDSDLMPYLASRYFGTRSVSSGFAWLLAAFFIGAAIGPTAFASYSTAVSSPVPPLYALIALQIVPIILFITLGRYPAPQVATAAATLPA